MSLELMSNLGPETTGIAGVVIWVSVRDGGEPRLWVVMGDSLSHERLKDAAVVHLTARATPRGTLPPEIAVAVARFVEANRVVLLSNWNAEISTREMLDALETVSP